ncbi:MAG TPA: ring-cleaving dioxygenase [Gemmatimonadales bacterium]
MDRLIRSLHHVTATVSDAQEDLDFYIGLLGMRLVKKTVNFDNHNVFHFYYGNEHGVPGTIMTTFPYKGWGVPAGTKGAGQITVTSFSVPGGSLGFWRARLQASGLAVGEGARFGDERLLCDDPSGLMIELIANDRDRRVPWVTDDIGADNAVRGVHGVTLAIRDPVKTLELMTDVLGFEVVDEADGCTRLAVGGDEPGKTIDVLHAPEAPAAVNGLGTVHHVAMAISDADEQLRMRDELIRLGRQVTEVRDRQYFKSIYFREPGGVLFEIATAGPGFTVDEELPCLGHDLKLPPWEEPHRAEIERGLPPVVHG